MPIPAGSEVTRIGPVGGVPESGSSGRRRSERARQAILSAARDLVADASFEKMTIEAVAARAGVGKQTVYRWWPSKAAVVAEAVLEGGEGDLWPLVPASALANSDLHAWAGDLADRLADHRGAAMLRALVSAASEDADIAKRLYDRFTAPFHTAVISQIAATRQGSVASMSDIHAAADMLVGGLVFLVMTRTESITRERADAMIRLVLRGLAPR